MATTGSEAQVQEMYIAYYGRPADPAGLEFWAMELDNNGGNLDAIVNAFGNSDEARALYGIADLKEENQSAFLQDDAAVDGFISAIYKQLFDRDPDALGLTFYREGLQDGTFTLQSAALDILNGAKNADGSYKSDTDGQSLENKKTVADCFTENLDESDAVDGLNEAAAYSGQAAIDIGRDLLSQFDDESDVSDAAVDAACSTSIDTLVGRDPAPGTATLTVNPDTVTANIIDAPRAFTPGGDDQVNTLDDDDVITGDGDNPTLNWTAVTDSDTADIDVQPTLNGVETVNVDVRTGNDAVLDLQDSTGVKNVNVDGVDNDSTFTIDNMQSAEDVDLSINDSNGENIGVRFLFDGDALTGSADSVDLALNDVDLAFARVEDEAGATGEALETLNINSTGDANTVDNLIAQGLTTLNITGDEAITISDFTGAAGTLNTVDASTMTEKVVLNLEEEFNAGQAGTSGVNVALDVKTGSADDTVTAAAIGSTDVLDMGEGTDTLKTHSASTATVVGAGTITNVEQLDIRKLDNGDAVLTADTSKVGGLEQIILRNEDNDGSSATFKLNELAATMPIQVMHSVTNSNDVADTIVEANLANAAGTSDTVAVEIVDGVNTDTRFNMTLDADGESATGTADGGAVENITLADNDTEDNAVVLTKMSEHTGTITLTGGQDGKFLDLDAGNSEQRDRDGGSNNDVKGYQDASGASTIVAATIDATAHAGDVTVRVSESATATATKDQSIMMGAGDDIVIFDEAGSSTSGLDILDTVSGGEGHDILALDGNVAANLGASEWTNVSGMDEIRLVGTGALEGHTPAAATFDPATGAGYKLILTNELVDSTDGGSNIAIVNDSGETTGANAIESSASIDARDLNPGNSFSYDGEENTTTSDGATKDVFIFDDASMNGTHVIDGGDENTGLAKNSDIVEIYNTAIVTAGDFANIKNIGEIRIRSDQTTDQTITMTLTDAVLDQFDTSQAAVDSATGRETICITSPIEPGAVGNKILNLDLSGVTDKFILDATDLGPDTVLGTITDPNGVLLGPAAPTYSIADVAVAEDVAAGTVDVIITRAGNTSFATTVDVASADGTATAGADYTALATTTVSFAAGETTKTVTIPIINDAIVEGATPETFTVNLSNASFGTITDASATVTIADDDANPGTTANDTLAGTTDNDSIDGLAGNDTITGDAGNDTLAGNSGIDSIDGGAGDDVIDGGDDNDTLNGNSGTDSISGGAGSDVIDAGNDADTVDGGAGIDSVEGGAGNDSIVGGADGDTVAGDAGNDTIDGGAGTDNLDGGADNDSISGGADIDTVLGAAGNDTLDGGAGSDSIDGGADNDLITGDAGIDTIEGGAGNDTIDGGADADSINGDAGADSISGGAGNDHITDSVAAGTDNDTIDGGAGNDTIESGTGSDSIVGGAGNDQIVDSNAADTGNDTIDGGAGNDTIATGTGSDSISAGAGTDTVQGGIGADTIDLGAGDTNADVVNVASAAESNITGWDVIHNFEGSSDQILAAGDVTSLTNVGVTSATTVNLQATMQAAISDPGFNSANFDSGDDAILVSIADFNGAGAATFLVIDDGSNVNTIDTDDTVIQLVGTTGILTFDDID